MHIHFTLSYCPTKDYNTHTEYVISGWSDHVKDKHVLARDAFLARGCGVAIPRQILLINAIFKKNCFRTFVRALFSRRCREYVSMGV